jgi:hypothetical protein
VVEVIRRAQPHVHFSLEMIVRDPLRVPCLTDEYWASFDEVKGRDLARALARIRHSTRRGPLPRITGLSEAERTALEYDLVDRCIRYAATELGLR